jgi:hypothetical protein
LGKKPPPGKEIHTITRAMQGMSHFQFLGAQQCFENFQQVTIVNKFFIAFIASCAFAFVPLEK